MAPHGRVALLERESQPGYHATGRSAALFMETYGTPMVRALTRTSRAFYTQPPAGFAEHPLLTPRGAMHVAKVGQEQELAATFAVLRASSSQVERLSVREVLARCPVLREDQVCGADGGQPRFFWLAAQGGYGIQTAAAASGLAAALVHGAPVPEHLLRSGVRAESMSPQRLR